MSEFATSFIVRAAIGVGISENNRLVLIQLNVDINCWVCLPRFYN